MPEKATTARARKDKRQGKSASTQAGEYVREEVHHVRSGKHGARSAKQAIAIGLSKARKAGVKIKRNPNAKKRTTKTSHHKVSATRSRATLKALKHEKKSAGSHRALSAHAHKAAGQRSAAARSRSAKKAARTRKKHAAA